ncbi:hypothetical protein C0991_009955 [Blastosporella zonata]|nr:hypothetical protein C0991_009955 [Blastosporella zonata]
MNTDAQEAAMGLLSLSPSNLPPPPSLPLVHGSSLLTTSVVPLKRKISSGPSTSDSANGHATAGPSKYGGSGAKKRPKSVGAGLGLRLGGHTHMHVSFERGGFDGGVIGGKEKEKERRTPKSKSNDGAESDHEHRQLSPNPQPEPDTTDRDTIRCICGSTFDDGFSIACDICLRWCHAACFGIVQGEVPDEWKCWLCDPSVKALRRAMPLVEDQVRRNGHGRRLSALEGSGHAKKRRRMSSAQLQAPEGQVDEDVVIDIEVESHTPLAPHANTIPSPDTRAHLHLLAASQHWRGVSALTSYSPTSSPAPPQTALSPLPSPSPIHPPSYTLRTLSPLPARTLITPLTSQITPSATYLADPLNAYAHLGLPKPFVHLLGPPLDLALDARMVGDKGRWVRSGCRPNAVLRPVLCASERSSAGAMSKAEEQDTRTLGFAVFALRDLTAGEEVVLGWEWDDGHAIHHLPALLKTPGLFPPAHQAHLRAQMANILHLLTSTFPACACGAHAADCALSAMERFVLGADDAPVPEKQAHNIRGEEIERDGMEELDRERDGPGEEEAESRSRWEGELEERRPYEVDGHHPHQYTYPSQHPGDARLPIHSIDHYSAFKDTNTHPNPAINPPIPIPIPTSTPKEIDLGPLVGTTRGFRTRERAPGSGGMGGVEMWPHEASPPYAGQEEDRGEGPSRISLDRLREIGMGKEGGERGMEVDEEETEDELDLGAPPPPHSIPSHDPHSHPHPHVRHKHKHKHSGAGRNLRPPDPPLPHTLRDLLNPVLPAQLGEGAGGENELGKEAKEDKMPPKMRKRWIREAGEALALLGADSGGGQGRDLEMAHLEQAPTTAEVQRDVQRGGEARPEPKSSMAYLLNPSSPPPPPPPSLSRLPQAHHSPQMRQHPPQSPQSQIQVRVPPQPHPPAQAQTHLTQLLEQLNPPSDSPSTSFARLSLNGVSPLLGAVRGSASPSMRGSALPALRNGSSSLPGSVSPALHGASPTLPRKSSTPGRDVLTPAHGVLGQGHGGGAGFLRAMGILNRDGEEVEEAEEAAMDFDEPQPLELEQEPEPLHDMVEDQFKMEQEQEHEHEEEEREHDEDEEEHEEEEEEHEHEPIELDIDDTVPSSPLSAPPASPEPPRVGVTPLRAATSPPPEPTPLPKEMSPVRELTAPPSMPTSPPKEPTPHPLEPTPPQVSTPPRELTPPPPREPTPPLKERTPPREPTPPPKEPTPPRESTPLPKEPTPPPPPREPPPPPKKKMTFGDYKLRKQKEREEREEREARERDERETREREKENEERERERETREEEDVSMRRVEGDVTSANAVSSPSASPAAPPTSAMTVGNMTTVVVHSFVKDEEDVEMENVRARSPSPPPAPVTQLPQRQPELPSLPPPSQHVVGTEPVLQQLRKSIPLRPVYLPPPPTQLVKQVLLPPTPKVIEVPLPLQSLTLQAKAELIENALPPPPIPPKILPLQPPSKLNGHAHVPITPAPRSLADRIGPPALFHSPPSPLRHEGHSSQEDGEISLGDETPSPQPPPRRTMLPMQQLPPEQAPIAPRPQRTPHTVTPPRGPRALYNGALPVRRVSAGMSQSPVPVAVVPIAVPASVASPAPARAPPTGPRSLRLGGAGGYQSRFGPQRGVDRDRMKGRGGGGVNVREESIGPEEQMYDMMGGRRWGPPPRGPSTDRDRDDRDRERNRERRGSTGGGGGRWGR